MYKTIIVVSCRVVRQLFGRGKPAPDKMPRFTFRRNKVQRPPCGREAHAHFRSSRNIRGKSPARSALSGRMKPKINKTEPSKKQEGNGAIRAPGANLTRAFRAGVGRDRKKCGSDSFFLGCVLVAKCQHILHRSTDYRTGRVPSKKRMDTAKYVKFPVGFPKFPASRASPVPMNTRPSLRHKRHGR